MMRKFLSSLRTSLLAHRKMRRYAISGGDYWMLTFKGRTAKEAGEAFTFVFGIEPRSIKEIK